MEILRASVLVVGIGISLIGAYFIADGITGAIVSQSGSLLEMQQIPVGIIAVVFGIGSIMTSHFLFLKRKNNAEAAAQQVVEAPSTATVVVEKPQQPVKADVSASVLEKPRTVEAPESAVITLAETTVSQTTKEVRNMAKKKKSAKKSAKKSTKKSAKKKKSKKRK